MFNWDKINLELNSLVDNNTFQQFVQDFCSASTVGYVAHGGNLAICDHAAIDATRHTDKMCSAPGSGIVATSLFTDFKNHWQREWIARTNYDAYVLITASGSSESITSAVNWLETQQKPYIIITGRSQNWSQEVVLNLESYHEFECAALASTYILLEQSGYTCPKIS
jgi:DNA-binding MurR/RpiR family transcriptional regulator